MDGLLHFVDVVLVEVDSEFVMEGHLERLLVLVGHTHSILKAVDLGAIVSVVDPVEDASEALGVDIEPLGLSEGANQAATGIVGASLNHVIVTEVTASLVGLFQIVRSVMVEP